MDSCDINVEPNRGMEQLRMKLDEMIQSSKETLYSIDQVIEVKTTEFQWISCSFSQVQTLIQAWQILPPFFATGLSPATLPTKGLGFF